MGTVIYFYVEKSINWNHCFEKLVQQNLIKLKLNLPHNPLTKNPRKIHVMFTRTHVKESHVQGGS